MNKELVEFAGKIAELGMTLGELKAMRIAAEARAEKAERALDEWRERALKAEAEMRAGKHQELVQR